MEPVFAQHTDCPSTTVMEDGVNAYSVMFTVTAAPLFAHKSLGVDDDIVELLQAMAARVEKATSSGLMRMDKNLT
jgi:hypothetical protein